MMKALLVSALVASTASAEPPRAWLGTFQPATPVAPCASCAKRTIAPGPGSVRILTAPDRVAPPADVVIVSPLLGVVARGTQKDGKLAVSWFDFDTRGDDDGVLVLPGGTPIALPAPTAADARAIAQALLRDDSLSGVRRALVGLEIGVIDSDGDGAADFAVTYGCNAWWDGQCQSKGQFFLVRHGTRWQEIE